MREPPFWWRASGLEAMLLAPAAALYGAVAARRLARSGHRTRVPVVCIGNPTVGGAGKTPLALATAAMLRAAGEQAVFLSRGYGGTLQGPILVDAARHRAVDVGDEPLLLAAAAPTVVSRDRVSGAEAAVAAGASVIVMDDGFQNPSLLKDFAVLVIDARRGLGNARVFPAGPLRAPLEPQLRRAQAMVVVGTSGDSGIIDAARAHDLPVFRARLEPDAAFLDTIRGARVLAFAGIGDPEKFFATLEAAGVAVAARESFADHHRYTAAEAQALCARADRDGLVLVTTEKDLARLRGDEATAPLAMRAQALPVTLVLDGDASFGAGLIERVAAARRSIQSR
jgi:tetraacyldisaccharide 4'-kinase